MPFGAHWSQILILLVLALVVFGPKRLPEVGSAIGKTVREFQKSMHTLTESESPPTPAALTPPVAKALPTAHPANPATATSPPGQNAAGASEGTVEARRDENNVDV